MLSVREKEKKKKKRDHKTSSREAHEGIIVDDDDDVCAPINGEDFSSDASATCPVFLALNHAADNNGGRRLRRYAAGERDSRERFARERERESFILRSSISIWSFFSSFFSLSFFFLDKNTRKIRSGGCHDGRIDDRYLASTRVEDSDGRPEDTPLYAAASRTRMRRARARLDEKVDQEKHGRVADGDAMINTNPRLNVPSGKRRISPITLTVASRLIYRRTDR